MLPFSFCFTCRSAFCSTCAPWRSRGMESKGSCLGGLGRKKLLLCTSFSHRRESDVIGVTAAVLQVRSRSLRRAGPGAGQLGRGQVPSGPDGGGKSSFCCWCRSTNTCAVPRDPCSTAVPAPRKLAFFSLKSQWPCLMPGCSPDSAVLCTLKSQSLELPSPASTPLMGKCGLSNYGL